MKQLLIIALAFTVSGCLMGTNQNATVTSNGAVVSHSHYDYNGLTSNSESFVELAPHCEKCKAENPTHPEYCTQLCYPMGYAGGGMMGGSTPAQNSLMLSPGAFVPTAPQPAAPTPVPTTASSQFVTKQEYHGDMKLMSKALDCLNKKQKGITDPKCTGK